jgi:hypothetical protein
VILHTEAVRILGWRSIAAGNVQLCIPCIKTTTGAKFYKSRGCAMVLKAKW